MKYIFKLTFILSNLLCFSHLSAQHSVSDTLTTPKNKARLQRCATVESINQRLKKDPTYNAQFQLKKKEFLRFKAASSPFTTSTAKLTAPIIIPVVVHIVLPNPQIITDADVQYFINRLNLDFSGKNPDSTNAALFYGVRGHSLIQFTLAKRDPSGRPTTGIVRKSSSTNIGFDEPQAIKSNATGGLNPWPNDQYYNLWVGASGSGLLGIAPEIGPGTITNDGVCINYLAFGNNTCYTDPTFALARTAVHEIGHNFGLFHIFEGGCEDEDFQQLTSPSMTLPAALLKAADDTPAQNDETSGCPSGVVSSGCPTSPTPPGRMYQNFMDYTDDACYSLFTKGQVERMHYVIENFRPGYLTTQGHIPVSAPVALDASVFETVNPGGSEVNGCEAASYTSTLFCPGTITPKFRIRNTGTTTISTITIGYHLNNGTAVTKTLTVNLAPNATTVVSFSPVAVTYGNNQFKFFISNPNGQADQNTSNDTLVTSLAVSSPINGGLTERFEGAFPPQGWSIRNPDNDITWQHINIGKNSNGSAYMNNYNYSSFEQKDDLYTPVIQFSNVDSVKLAFDLSAAVYSDPTTTTIPIDTLEILVTKDCGNTFTSVYKKWGTELQTLGDPNREYTDEFFPNNSEFSNPAAVWRSELVDLSAFKDAGSILVAFRNTTNWENNIFIDNVQLYTRLLPPLLKEKGYLVLPTLNNGKFGVWLYNNHTKLKFINIFNTSGHLIWKKEFKGDANTYNPVDLQGQPAGTYFVKWGYEGESRTVTERIIIQ